MVTTRSSIRIATGFSSESTAHASPVNGNGSGNGASNAKKHKASSTSNSVQSESKRQKVAEPVDKTRWRLNSDDGRHTWHYLDDDKAVKEWPQSYAEKWYLDLPLVRILRLCYKTSQD